MSEEIKRSLKFCLFECSAGIIQFTSFAVLEALTAWSYWPCYLIALVLSVMWSFTFNRRYTFRSVANVPVAMAKVGLFYAMFTPVSTVAGSFFADGLGVNGYLVTVVSMLANFALEYLWDRYLVFGSTMDTNAVAARARVRFQGR